MKFKEGKKDSLACGGEPQGVLRIQNTEAPWAGAVKGLGVWVDSALNFEKHMAVMKSKATVALATVATGAGHEGRTRRHGDSSRTRRYASDLLCRCQGKGLEYYRGSRGSVGWVLEPRPPRVPPPWALPSRTSRGLEERPKWRKREEGSLSAAGAAEESSISTAGGTTKREESSGTSANSL